MGKQIKSLPSNLNTPEDKLEEHRQNIEQDKVQSTTKYKDQFQVGRDSTQGESI